MALASKQFGVVTLKDCAAYGVSRSWLRRRIETGEWTRLHPGVFRHGSNSPSLDELEMAAMLAAGDGAVLSHLSAARRLGLDVPRQASVQITIPASRRIPKLRGVKVFRSRNLTETHTTKRGPFRLTHLARSPARWSTFHRFWIRRCFGRRFTRPFDKKRQTSSGFVELLIATEGVAAGRLACGRLSLNINGKTRYLTAFSNQWAWS